MNYINVTRGYSAMNDKNQPIKQEIVEGLKRLGLNPNYQAKQTKKSEGIIS